MTLHQRLHSNESLPRAQPYPWQHQRPRRGSRFAEAMLRSGQEVMRRTMQASSRIPPPPQRHEGVALLRHLAPVDDRLAYEEKTDDAESVETAGAEPESMSPPSESKLSSKEQLSALRRRIAELETRLAFPGSESLDAIEEKGLLCTICFERGKDTALVPCGHFICAICTSRIRETTGRRSRRARCPFCRARIQGQQRVHI